MKHNFLKLTKVVLENEAKTNIPGFAQFAHGVVGKESEMKRNRPITLFCEMAVRNDIGLLGEKKICSVVFI